MTQRMAWTQEEDRALIQVYEVRGVKRWVEVGRLLSEEYQIPNRNGKQCRQRYHNHLDSNISHQKWTPQQENQLLELHNSLGNCWAEITRILKGRSENSVKNQFYSILRRGLRKVNKVIRERLKRFREIDLHILSKIDDGLSPRDIKGLNLKRKLAFFGLAHVDSKQIETEHIRKIIEQSRTTAQHRPSRSKREASLKQEAFLKQEENPEDSQEIESEEYRDDCPVGHLQLKKTPFTSFRLEEHEDREEHTPKLNSRCPTLKRKMSLQSVESPQVRLEVNQLRVFDLLGTEGQLDYLGDFNRVSPQVTCESPYFDQSHWSWPTVEKS